MRDLDFVDRTIVVKGQSKQENPAGGARGKFARARELQADCLPVHTRCLGQIRRFTEYAMLRSRSGGIDRGPCQTFPRSPPLEKIRLPGTRKLDRDLAAQSQLRICELSFKLASLHELGPLAEPRTPQSMVRRSAGLAVGFPGLFASRAALGRLAAILPRLPKRPGRWIACRKALLSRLIGDGRGLPLRTAARLIGAFSAHRPGPAGCRRRRSAHPRQARTRATSMHPAAGPGRNSSRHW